MPKHLTITDQTTAEFVLPSQVGVANGVAALDSSGTVPLSQLPSIAAGNVTSVNGKTGIVSLTYSDVSALGASQVGVANGAAGLDGSGKLAVGQIPTTVLQASIIGANNGVAGLDSSGFLDLTHVHTNTANGLLKLDGSGKVASAQSLVQSVNGNTGTIVLGPDDVGAVDINDVGSASGVASLNSSGHVPQGELPDLSNLYVPVPGATATAAGQLYSSTAPGSNSAQWVTPLAYTSVDVGHRPVSPPVGSTVTQTDTNTQYVYGGSQWFRINADVGIPKYASAAARDSDFPSPPDGQHIYRTDLHQTFWYNGLLSQWLPINQGTWTAYVPAWTTIDGLHIPSIGNGSIKMRYNVVGKTVNYSFRLVAGSTTNAGASGSTNNWTFSLPVAASSAWDINANGFQIGTGAVTPTTGTLLNGCNAVLASTTTFYVQIIGGPPSGASVASGILDEGTPSAWSTTGWIQMSGSYEAA